MKIKLNKCDHMADWYTIVRAEHDGREWWEAVGENAYSYSMSERLSPEACIEGNREEMREIANAINCGGAVSFKRCAVRINDGVAYFWSPKNSERDAAVPLDDAIEFADQVLRELSP